MDIIGPFPPTSGQRRFLVVAVDYFIRITHQNHIPKDLIIRDVIN